MTASECNEYILRIIEYWTKNEKWNIPTPKIRLYNNRIYGDKMKTLWLTWPNCFFEIGVYPFAKSVEFGIQVTAPGENQFYSEVAFPMPEKIISYFSRATIWIIEQIYIKLSKKYSI